MRKFLLGLAAAASLAPFTTVTAQEDGASVVQRHIDAYRARNMTEFLKTFAPDAVVNYEGMEFRGHTQIRKVYSANFTPDAPKVVIYSSGGENGAVWIETGYVFPNGEELCCGFSEYTVANGKITYVSVSGPG